MMKRQSPVAPLLLLAALVLMPALARPAAAQDSAQPQLNVRLGLWEATTVVESSGAPPMDMSKLTPEQRARMEAALAASKQRASTPHTRQECLTKEKLAKTLFDNKGSESCKQTVTTNTASTYAFKVACGMPDGGTSNGEWRFEAVTPELVKGKGELTMEGAGHKMTSQSTMSAKFLSASCGKVK